MLNSSDPYRIDMPFEQTLREELLPVLHNFFRLYPHEKQVIWMQQSNTLDILAPIRPNFGAEVNVKKLQDYNDIIRRILKYVLVYK